MITDDNKKKISDTLNNLYNYNFREPIFNILNSYTEWYNNTDEFEKKAISEGMNGKVFCDCPFLSQNRDYNVVFKMLSCGRIEFELIIPGGGSLFITWDTDLGFMHFPSFETIASEATHLVMNCAEDVNNFVNAHFTRENGKFVSDLIGVKRYLGQDFSSLFKCLADIVNHIIEDVSNRADEIEMKDNNDEYELRKAFDLGTEKPKRKFVKIEVSIERV